ncbi:MAG: arylsulfatase [Gammaproteobacteria bacterium]|nr:MAG: arylsulfatase [Gammaproteobacteria bacterium]
MRVWRSLASLGLLVTGATALMALMGCVGDKEALTQGPYSVPGLPGSTSAERPNILLIVADDLGYADLGIYGSEIATPNLDALARSGVMFTQFYASPMCSPTRAMLLTGMDNHRAGLGSMAERLAGNQQGQPGYEGYLNSRAVTLAEVLRDAGYRTYMTGKWHLGEPGVADPPLRGFEQSFALLDSGAGHFSNRLSLGGPEMAPYFENGKPVEHLPRDFYSTRFYAQKLIEYLDADRNDDRPFFAYLAFTAPHFPLQAPEESIARYRGLYDAGYEAVQARRLSTMRDLGLVAADAHPFPRLVGELAWEKLSPEQQKAQARLMEIYAAMVGDLDAQVGEVIRFLRRRREYDSTIIVFMSDNGPEGHHLEQGLERLAEWSRQCCNNEYDNMGRADSYLMQGPDWARVSATPFRMFKGFTSEGGIRVAAFISYPRRIAGGRTYRGLATVMDVMPTLLDLAGAEHPGESFQGRKLLPMQGRSMLPMLRGVSGTVHDNDAVLGWELFGKRAIRRGDWKIVREASQVKWWQSDPLGIRRDSWQLYNLTTDPAELNDLSAQHPAQLQHMIDQWDVYARGNGVIIPDEIRNY